MKRIRSIAVFALSLACSLGMYAQTHPNLEKGFAPDKMYQFGDVDQVNIFNGNLSLTIPIGGTTPVSDHLSLPLTLVYNSKLWSAKEKSYCPSPDNCASSLFYTPERRSNAGFGWTLAPGRLIDPLETDINNDAAGFIYESPDGSDRLFYDTLHEHGVGVSPEPTLFSVKYSRDSTYLRLSTGGAGEILESPDGTIREFESYTDGIANTTCMFPPCPSYTRWRLKQIRDRFGNHIDIDYSTSEQWRITDQYGRLTVVHFSPRASDVDAEYLEQISSIDVPATGGGTATYSFVYQDKWVMTGTCAIAHPDTPAGYKLPLLMSMTLPDGSSYAFTYTGPIADSLTGLGSTTDPCLVGGLASATLPTKASISYTYQEYQLPVLPCGDDPMALSSGIMTRVVHDPFNPGNDQTWQYAQSFNYLGGTTLCPGPIHVDEGASEYINTVTVSTAAEPVAQKTRYYFSVYHGKTTDANGTTPQEYGLPFSRIHPFDSSHTRFLSTETLSAASVPVRSTYLRYAHDPPKGLNDQFNARVSGNRTVFLDDDEAAGNALGKHMIDTDYDASSFDGVGHYRSSTISGDLFGSPRTITTAYNTADSLVNPNALATGSYDGSATGGSFVPPPVSTEWVLNLYPTMTTSEGGTPAVQEACFNKTNGFLSGTRIRGGAGRANTDLIAVFGSDSMLTGGMVGAITSEKYYGGDVFPLTSSLTQTLCDTVAGTPGPLGYDIRHSYLYGVRATSEYYKNGTTIGYRFLDQADTVVAGQTVHGIDPSTGLVTHSRDTAGVEMASTYDTSRRTLTVQNGDDPLIHYLYTNATGSAGANVTIYQSSATSGTPQASFDYDGFGRLVLQSRSLPAMTLGGPARWTRQRSVYDAMGRKIKISEWEESSSPSHFTMSSAFDMFGRPGTIAKPDGTTTTFAYHGVRQIDRTAHIHTQSGADTDSITKEIYDLHGQLHQVREHNDVTATTYTYDVGGRLQGVSMTGDGTTQTRSFTYDNRGFLSSEVHPEIGANGNGTTTYGQYDARGHVHNKTTGAANGTFDLRFVYDESEHLTDVYDNGGARQLKHFDFATANAGSNKQQGKLSQAVRVNHLAAGDITVTEGYRYESPSGRTSLRETLVRNGTTTLQDYQQLFEYDDLGALKTPGYPTCLSGATCNGTSGLTSATYTYRDGSLVGIPNYASNIAYSGNMISQVDHQNGVSDVYRQDVSNGMARPSSIAFQNVTSCSVPNAPVVTASSPVCAGSTGNTASVPANASVLYQWSITGGTITGTTANSVTYTAGGTGTLTLSVTATNACGTSAPGTRNVTVATGPAATLTVTGATTITRGSSATLHVALTGTPPWTVTWSDTPSQPQTVGASFDRAVTPQTTTTYNITAISDSSAAPCNTGPASGGVTITVQMPAPTSMMALLDANNSRLVHLTWSAVSGATYRLERSTCMGCGWTPIQSSIATNSTDYLADPTTLPSAALYHVIAIANGTSDSPPSPYDFATTATLLFAEPIASNGVTTIKGSHVQELRKAIDELRRAANRPPAWTDYSAPTGLIFANDVLVMRSALDDAVFQLTGIHITFTGQTPALGGLINAYQFTQLRAGVK